MAEAVGMAEECVILRALAFSVRCRCTECVGKDVTLFCCPIGIFNGKPGSGDGCTAKEYGDCNNEG